MTAAAILAMQDARISGQRGVSTFLVGAREAWAVKVQQLVGATSILSDWRLLIGRNGEQWGTRLPHTEA